MIVSVTSWEPLFSRAKNCALSRMIKHRGTALLFETSAILVSVDVLFVRRRNVYRRNVGSRTRLYCWSREIKLIERKRFESLANQVNRHRFRYSSRTDDTMQLLKIESLQSSSFRFYPLSIVTVFNFARQLVRNDITEITRRN